MNIKTVVVMSAAALALTACGGGASGDGVPSTSGGQTSGGSPSEGEATPEGGGSNGGSSKGGGSNSTPPDAPRRVDIVEVGEALQAKGWECNTTADTVEKSVIVDMAGFRKVSCIIPDRYAVPGQDGNSVSLVEMDSFETADAYAEYGNTHTRYLDGIIFDGATGKAVSGAVKDAGDLVHEFKYNG